MNNSKTIVFIIWSLEIGGAERQAIMLANELKEKYNYNVIFFGLNMKGNAIPLLNSLNIKWIFYPFELSGKIFYDYKLLFKAILAVRRLKPNYIISYTYLPNILGGIIWKYTGASKFIWCQRDIGRNFDGSKIEKIAIRETKLFTTNSNEGFEYLTQNLKIDPAKIQIVRNGIELAIPKQNRFEWRNQLEIPMDSFVATKIANITDAKDHKTLILGWNELIKKTQRSDLVLLLVGRFGNKYNETVKLIEELNLQKNIKLLGFVEDVSGVISASDLGVFSSLKEGSPNGVLECMAGGLPIVAPKIKAIEEILGGDYPFLYIPGDYKMLATQIQNFIEDISLRIKENTTNLNIILNNYSKKSMAEAYYKLLD